MVISWIAPRVAAGALSRPAHAVGRLGTPKRTRQLRRGCERPRSSSAGKPRRDLLDQPCTGLWRLI